MHQREIELSPEDALQFDGALSERRALMEASELIARQYAQKLEENNKRLGVCYEQAAAKHGIDLQTCQYEFRVDRLVLTACRFNV